VPSRYTFTDPRLVKLDGFQVQLDESHERGDIILNRPPYNVVSMTQRDQLRLAFETLDADMSVRIIVVRAVGEHFSSGWKHRRLYGSLARTCFHLAWNIASLILAAARRR
jgi:2-oxoglutaroyl-CoA hydrolase